MCDSRTPHGAGDGSDRVYACLIVYEVTVVIAVSHSSAHLCSASNCVLPRERTDERSDVSCRLRELRADTPLEGWGVSPQSSAIHHSEGHSSLC